MADSCEVQKKFSCDRCPYKGKTRVHLLYHKRVHKEKVFHCSQCDFKTQRKYYLDHHNIIHSEESRERPFVCKHNGCTHSFFRAGNLVAHQLVHSKLKRFKCNLCGKCFKRSSDLNCHIRTHTGEKPYKCLFEGCEYSSTHAGSLKPHFRRHTGEKPYRCSYKACEYSSIRGDNLKRHEMTHNDGKVFTCSFKECKYSSTIKGDLTKHITLLHLRNKLQVCQSCEYRSETAAELKRHMTKNHQKAHRTSINRPRLKSSNSRSLIETESTNSVSHSKLIKRFEVDEDPNLIAPTFPFVRLTRLKSDNCSYSKNIPATSAIHFEASRDLVQKTKSRPSNSLSAEDDPKLRIPTIVVLKRLQVNYDSDDGCIGDSLGIQADLAIQTASDCTEMNPDPQTGPMPKKANSYTCKMCGYETKTLGTFKLHLQTHREKGEFFCPLCDFVCFKKRLFKSHFQTHDHDSSASDSDCYSDTQSLPAHISSTSQDTPFDITSVSVNTSCFESQSSQKKIDVQLNAMGRIARPVTTAVQLQEIRAKRNQSLTNPNLESHDEKKLSSQSAEKKRFLFSCTIF